MRKTLYNTKAKSVCGRCHHHNCGITVRQLKAKKCLAKQCHYLERYEEHEYWHQRALQKANKKAKKMEANVNGN